MALAVRLVVLSLFCILSTQAEKLTWEKVFANSSVGPESRRDAALGYDKTRNTLVVFGGRSRNGVLRDTWLFHLANKTWTKLPDNAVTGERFSLVYGVWKEGFYVATGEGENDFYDDIIHLNLQTLNWRKLPQGSVKPEKRYGAGGGVDPNGDALYVSHGFSGRRYSNTFKYDLVKEKWEVLYEGTNSYNPSAPHARCLQGATMISPTEFVMYGGCLSGGLTGGPCPSDDSWRFDGKSKEWTRLDNCASPRMYSSMALLPDNITDSDGKEVKAAVLYGGNEESGSILRVEKSITGEVAILDLSTNKWSRRNVEGAEVPENRQGASMATGSTGTYMFGGSLLSDGTYTNEIWLLKSGNPYENPSAGSCNNEVFSLIMLHGVFMFIGWGVLLQAGAFIARYFRHRDPWWFKVHRIVQVSGLVFSIAGLICAVQSVRFGHLMFAHGQLGVVIMVLGLQQPLNAFIRPHKSEDGIKTLKRRIWEYVHKIGGRLALVLALINISLGVFFGMLPLAVWVIWFILLAGLCVAYVIMEIRLVKKTDSSDSLQMGTVNQ